MRYEVPDSGRVRPDSGKVARREITPKQKRLVAQTKVPKRQDPDAESAESAAPETPSEDETPDTAQVPQPYAFR